jgi:hypothetical protein
LATSPSPMASGINPQILMALLKAKHPGGAAGAATGTGSGDDSIAPAVRQLQQSNPDYFLKLVTDMRKQIYAMLPVLSQMNPASARALLSTIKGFDSGIKELQTAQATLNAVGGPIQSSAIPTPQAPGSSTPSLPNPANVSM